MLSLFTFIWLLSVLEVSNSLMVNIDYNTDTKPDIYAESQLNITCDITWPNDASTSTAKFISIFANRNQTGSELDYGCQYSEHHDGSLVWNLLTKLATDYSPNPFFGNSKDGVCQLTVDRPTSFMISVSAKTKVDWVCWIRDSENKNYESTQFFMPDLKDAPTYLEISFNTDEFIVGDNVTVSCSSDGIPAPEFEYRIGEESFNGINGTSYEFIAEKSHHQMEVTCKNLEHLNFNGDQSLIETSKRITVFYLDVAETEVSKTFLTDSGEKSIECSVDTNADVTYEWSRDGDRIDEETTNTLIIIPSNTTETVMYTCAANVVALPLTKMVTFNVMWTNDTTTMVPATKEQENSTPKKDESVSDTTPDPDKDYTVAIVVGVVIIVIIVIVIIVIIVRKKRSQNSGLAEIKKNDPPSDAEAGNQEAMELEKQKEPLLDTPTDNKTDPVPESEVPKPEAQAPTPATE